VRGLAVIACAAAAVAIAACGGSSGPSSSSTSQPPKSATGPPSPGAALRAWEGAVSGRDGRAACRLMSAHARRAIRFETRRGCVAFYGSPSHPPIRPPRIVAIGARGDVALGVLRSGSAGAGGVTVLRRLGGRWLIDLTGVTPILASVPAPGTPPLYRESLPTTGPRALAALGAAGRYVDSAPAHAPSAHGHVTAAAVVGDVALAYVLAGSDVGAGKGGSPRHGLQSVLVMSRANGGWRVLDDRLVRRRLGAPS
jgi:hypothetical protein